MNGAVLWADFGHQHRTEQVGTALQLCTDSSAEIRHLIRRPHNLNSCPVCLPSVSRKECKVPCHQSHNVLWCYWQDSLLLGRYLPKWLLGERLSWEGRQNRSTCLSGSISEGLGEGKAGWNESEVWTRFRKECMCRLDRSVDRARDEKHHSRLGEDTTQDSKLISWTDAKFLGEGCSLSSYIDLW